MGYYISKVSRPVPYVEGMAPQKSTSFWTLKVRIFQRHRRQIRSISHAQSIEVEPAGLNQNKWFSKHLGASTAKTAGERFSSSSEWKSAPGLQHHFRSTDLPLFFKDTVDS